MKTQLVKLLVAITLFFARFAILQAIETDSLTIDPDNPLTTDPVQVQSYVTIGNCCTGMDSVIIYTNLVEYYWEQTQCSDPWQTGSGHSNEETYDSLMAYFNRQDVALHHITFLYDPELEEVCTACDCKTGTVIHIYIDYNDTSHIAGTGFRRGTDMLFDFIRSYHPEHYPACDCYCQCADTVDIGSLDAGDHRLIFNTIFIDSVVSASYEAYDTLDFPVVTIVSVQSNSQSKNDFILFPVPASDFIKLSENLSGCRYEIIDIYGRRLMTGTINHNYLNIRNLSPGTYLIKFYKENRIFIAKKLTVSL